MDSLIQIQSTLRTPVLFLLSVTFWIEMIVLYLPDLKQKSLGKERRVSKFSQNDASTAQHGEIQTFWWRHKWNDADDDDVKSDFGLSTGLLSNNVMYKYKPLIIIDLVLHIVSPDDSG